MKIDKRPFAKTFDCEKYGQFLVVKSYDNDEELFKIEIKNQCLDFGEVSVNYNFKTEESRDDVFESATLENCKNSLSEILETFINA